MADHYVRGRPLGEGTWGQVYEAFRKDNNKRVAIKRMRGKEPQHGLDFTALREIKYLQEIKGPYIEDVSSCGSLVFVHMNVSHDAVVTGSISPERRSSFGSGILSV